MDNSHAKFILTMCTKLQGMSLKLNRKETFVFFKKHFVTALNNLLQIEVFISPHRCVVKLPVTELVSYLGNKFLISKWQLHCECIDNELTDTTKLY